MNRTLKTRRTRAARTRRRGTASVEVVMMLPFFIILYAGIYYIHAHYIGRQQAQLRARACTWEFAASGCEDRRRLEACLKDPTDGEAPTDAPSVPGENEAPAVATSSVGGGSGVLDKLSKIPLLGGAITWLFGKPVTVTAGQLAHIPDKPSLDGTTAIRVSGKYYTMCNTVPKDWDDVAVQIFCEFMGDFPGC